MKQQCIRVGIIGAGFIANFHIIGYQMDPRVRVVAIADIVADKAKSLAKKYGVERYYNDFRELLDDKEIQAVSICTPHPSHMEVSLAAAERGKHILCEKPMSISVEQCNKMIEAAKQAKVKLMVGFITRFYPVFRKMKDLVEDNAIGEIVMLRSLRWGWIPWSEWYYDPQKGGGILFDRFCYGVDASRWYTKSEVSEIYVKGDTLVHKDKRKKFGTEFIDNAKIIMKMKNGVIASSEESYSAKFGYYERMEILGTEGVLLGDPTKHSMITMYSTHGSKAKSPFDGLFYPKGWSSPDLNRESFANETKHFIDCILEDKQPSVTGEDGLAATKVVLAGIESLKTGLPVRIS